MAVMDVSFISIKLILPAIFAALAQGGEVITLIKPQFEAPPQVLRKGVVRDPAAHVQVLQDMLAWFAQHRMQLQGLTFSPITGPKGNIEFLAHLTLDNLPGIQPDTQSVVEQAHQTLKG